MCGSEARPEPHKLSVKPSKRLDHPTNFARCTGCGHVDRPDSFRARGVSVFLNQEWRAAKLSDEEE